MKRLLKEPLLHFVIAGALLFGLSAWLDPSGGSGTGSRQVRIGEGEVKWLVGTWSRQWRREPTPEELHGLVTGLLKEELLSREAREMGLDEGDTIVRRRLAQKLEFLLQDAAQLVEPAEGDLRRLYEANRADFQVAARVSFTQVFFSPQRRKDAARDAVATLARMAATAPADPALGDPSMLEGVFDDADQQTVASAFGPEFASAVLQLKPGAWQGPIASAYGVHLVRVTHSTPAWLRPFEDSKTKVVELWREEKKRETEERYFRRLLDKYDVQIDEGVKSLIGPLPVAQLNGVGK
jgi:hypothetical protein